jgi:hypothetical protein
MSIYFILYISLVLGGKSIDYDFYFMFYNNCDITSLIYSNPPCQLSLWEETRGAIQRKPLTFGRLLTDSNFHMSLARTEQTIISEVKGINCSDNCAIEKDIVHLPAPVFP